MALEMSGDLSISAIAFVLVFFFGLYKFIIYPAAISPLSKIPNAHWSAPYSPLWILWVRYKHTENRDVLAAHQKLGPAVRLGPNEISVGTIDGGVKTVFGGGFEKGDWYAVFDNYGYENSPDMMTWVANYHTEFNAHSQHFRVVLIRQASV